jgi:hypothetical protein
MEFTGNIAGYAVSVVCSIVIGTCVQTTDLLVLVGGLLLLVHEVGSIMAYTTLLTMRYRRNSCCRDILHARESTACLFLGLNAIG